MTRKQLSVIEDLASSLDIPYKLRVNEADATGNAYEILIDNEAYWINVYETARLVLRAKAADAKLNSDQSPVG